MPALSVRHVPCRDPFFYAATEVEPLQVQHNKNSFECGILFESFVTYKFATAAMQRYSAHMDMILAAITLPQFLACFAVALLAGFVKGVVGFARPMVLISGMSSFIAPELALAGLIIPTIITNGVQAMRQGWLAAWASVVKFRRFLLVAGVMLLLSAQLVSVLSLETLLLMIGIPIVLFALMQLFGWTPGLTWATPRLEFGVSAVAGFLGGISGIWGPPTVLYLTALYTEKAEQIRVQGVIYGMGAVGLMGAHLA